MEHPDALVLTADEKTFGFQLLMVESDGVEQLELVVAYVLNDSEIVAKTTAGGKIVYRHRRWGTVQYKHWPGLEEPPEPGRPGWHPLGMTFYDDPGEAVQSSSFEPDDATLAPIVKRTFHFEPYDPMKHGG